MDKEKLQFHLNRFLKYKNRNWSSSAKRNNKYYFDLLLSFLKDRPFDKYSTQDFFDFLDTKKLAESTRHQAETSVLAFVSWLFQEDIIQKNWANRIERTKVHKVARLLPTLSEVVELIKKVTEPKIGDNVQSRFSKREHRDCLLFIATCAGTRNNETRLIKRSEVSISERQILIKEGKTGERMIPIAPIPWLVEMLERRSKPRNPEEARLLADRKRYKADYSDLLFVVNPKRLETIMRDAGKHLGKPLNVHDLRRINLRDLKKNGAGIDDIKNVAGHKNIETTLGYLTYDTNDQQKTLKNFSSIARTFRTKEEKSKELVNSAWSVGSVVDQNFDGEFLTMKVKIN